MNIVPDLAGPLLMVLHETQQIIVYYTKVTLEMVSGVREIVEKYYAMFDDSEHSIINELVSNIMGNPEFLDKLLKVLEKIGEALFRWLIGIGIVFTT